MNENEQQLSKNAPAVLAIGQFDGIHIGHQAVLRRAVEIARELQGTSGALTFRPHPARILFPDADFHALETEDENERSILSTGVDACCSMAFTPEFARLSPEGFLGVLLAAFPGLKAMVTGWNFTFGRDAAGSADMLRQLADKAGIRVEIMPPVMLGGLPVSSTRIRQAVKAGDMPLAEELLGRPYGFSGDVVHGRHVGSRIGFPTANIQMGDVLRPAPGVYTASFQEAPDAPLRPSMAFVPDPADPAQAQFHGIVEVHVVDFAADVYGRHVHVLLHRRIRGHRNFDTLEALAAQLKRDMEVVERAETPAAAPREPRLWLFDMDGTLLDTLDDLTIAANQMRAQHGLPPLPKETVQNYIGRGIRALAISALEGHKADEETAVQQVRDAYAEHLFDQTHPLPEVQDTLQKLRGSPDKMGVVTNKPREQALRLINHFGWSDIFHVVLAGGDSDQLKPHPVPILKAMELTGIPPDRTWMIGDSEPDLEAARRANVKSIYLSSGFGQPGRETPTLTLSHFHQLLPLISP